MKDIREQECERGEELVSFLYGELGDREARQFERHLNDCGHCGAEVKSFGRIRSSIHSWRDESLGIMPAPVALPPERASAKPSALAAIGQFFSLAPMWMKAATVCASLIFCVSAALAVGYLRTSNRQPTTIVAPSDKIYSQLEMDARLALEKQKLTEGQQQQAPNSTVAIKNPSPTVVAKRNLMVTASARNLRKPLTRQERQELASDLGLVASRDEDDLDLGSDKINPSPR